MFFVKKFTMKDKMLYNGLEKCFKCYKIKMCLTKTVNRIYLKKRED